MSNVLSGGLKLHMMSYSGVLFDGSGKKSLRLSSRVKKSCGGNYKGLLNFSEFHKYMSDNSSSLCEKCKARYMALSKEARAPLI